MQRDVSDCLLDIAWLLWKLSIFGYPLVYWNFGYMHFRVYELFGYVNFGYMHFRFYAALPERWVIQFFIFLFDFQFFHLFKLFEYLEFIRIFQSWNFWNFMFSKLSNFENLLILQIELFQKFDFFVDWSIIKNW